MYLPVIALALSNFLRIPSSTQPSPEIALSTHDILAMSRAEANELVPEERAFFLYYLVDTASRVRDSSTREWLTELFSAAKQLPESSNRLALEKNALVVFSAFDPAESFKLLGFLDAPTGTKDQLPGEDPRVDGARIIYPRFWKLVGLAGIDSLRFQAHTFGDKGQYPFAAMIPVIKDVAKRDENTMGLLLYDAVQSFQSGGHVKAESAQFVQFLLDVRTLMPLTLMKEALHICVDRFSASTKPTIGETYLATAQSHNNGSRVFDSQSKLLLARLTPILKEVDPDLAAKLAKRSMDDVTGLTDNTEDVSAVATRGSSDPVRVAELQQMLLQKQRLDKIRSIASDNPNEAAHLSETLTDLALQSSAWAELSAAEALRNPARSHELLHRSIVGLKRVKDPTDQVSVLADQAQAASSQGDSVTLQEIVDRAFDIGVDAFESDLRAYPEKPAYDVQCFEPLRQLTRLMARVDPGSIVSRLEGLSSNILRSYLLVSAAEGAFELHEKQDSLAR